MGITVYGIDDGGTPNSKEVLILQARTTGNESGRENLCKPTSNEIAGILAQDLGGSFTFDDGEVKICADEEIRSAGGAIVINCDGTKIPIINF